MKTIAFILTTLLVLNFAFVFGQDKVEIINQIRKEYKIINHDTALKKVILKNESFVKPMTDGGGELAGYYKVGQLKKMVSWIGLSYGNRIFEYYFKNNKLIFIYEQCNSFVFDKEYQQFRLDTTEVAFEGRYYFHDNKLIDQITTGHKRFEDDSIDAEKTLLKEADDNRKLMDRKRRSHHN